MDPPRPIFLFTDFGWPGPYVGQMIAAILAVDPCASVVSLMHDAPAMRPDLAAYLLPACCRFLPRGSVVVAVVDPGVGSERAALRVDTVDLTFVGPDNGLLARLPGVTHVARIDWRPPRLSASFHGRDLFAPAAARLAAAGELASTPLSIAQMVGADWPEDPARVVYVDAFGNLMTGVEAEKFSKNRYIHAAGQVIGHAETFSRVPPGQLFWYANSQGLVEIAVNGVSAAGILSLAPGDPILLD
jgi:S-adenosylmethionine hydrolase